MTTPLRKKFIRLIGNGYDKFGYPYVCGWIEALLLLEPSEWSQKDISQRLSEIFPESDSPTSLASVNRALKLLENYGVVKKSGSRKLGYSYTIALDSSMMASYFNNFISMYDGFIDELSSLRSERTFDDDQNLVNAVDTEIQAYEFFTQALKELVKYFDMKDQED